MRIVAAMVFVFFLFFSTKSLHKNSSKKVFTKYVHKKCPQKVSTKSVHKKVSRKRFPQKGSTKRGPLKGFTKSDLKKCPQKVSPVTNANSHRLTLLTPPISAVIRVGKKRIRKSQTFVTLEKNQICVANISNTTLNHSSPVHREVGFPRWHKQAHR